MSDSRQQLIEFLEKDILDWEEAAQFCEQTIYSVQELGDSAHRSGRDEAENYRARIAERRELLEHLRKD